MTYIVNYTNENKPPLIIPENTVNSQTSLTLLGKKFPGYGEIVAENLLHMLENFSSNSPPQNPIEGQLWYNTAFDILNIYTSMGTWKSLGTITIGASNPTIGSSVTPGNIWINNLNNRIFVYSGVNWLELATINEGNGVFVKSRYDTNNTTHIVIEFCLDSEIIMIISNDETEWSPQNLGSTTEFIFNSGTKLADVFPIIKNGININGGIDANNINGNWVASTDDITNVSSLSNEKIMTPLRTDQMILDRLTRDNRYRATLEQATELSSPVNNRFMSPFLTREAYKSYVENKVIIDAYSSKNIVLKEIPNNTYVEILEETINVYEQPIFVNFSMAFNYVDIPGLRVRFKLNDDEIDFFSASYNTNRTYNDINYASYNFGYVTDFTGSASLKVEAAILGTPVTETMLNIFTGQMSTFVYRNFEIT